MSWSPFSVCLSLPLVVWRIVRAAVSLTLSFRSFFLSFSFLSSSSSSSSLSLSLIHGPLVHHAWPLIVPVYSGSGRLIFSSYRTIPFLPLSVCFLPSQGCRSFLYSALSLPPSLPPLQSLPDIYLPPLIWPRVDPLWLSTPPSPT